MKTSLIKAAALAAFLSLTTVAAQAQGPSQDAPIKIGYVNGERILRESDAAKASQAKLEAEFGKRNRDLADQDAKLHAAADKLDKDAPMLSESERARRQKDITDKSRDLQRQQREFQEDLNQRKNEEMSAIGDKANKAIKQIMDSGKYDIILQDAPFVSSRVDITQKVIDLLNAQK